MIIPEKLSAGDEIRIIAPSRSLSLVSTKAVKQARDYLSYMGYKVTFAEHCYECGFNDSAPVKSKVEDLHEAFSNPRVKAIIAAIGGFSSNQILENIDYSLISKNPKIFCGYSDISSLLNAIHTKTGLVTYHGPNFNSFGENITNYTIDSFLKCVAYNDEYRINPLNDGVFKIVNTGTAKGTIIGGNLSTLSLLQGTDFMPSLNDVVLFLEDINFYGKFFWGEFERKLQSLLQVKNCKINGIVLGKFQKVFDPNNDYIPKIVNSKIQLQDIPIISNVDVGHLSSFATFPIGGTAEICAEKNATSLLIKEH